MRGHRSESALLAFGAFGGAGGLGSGATRSRARGLEGQPHAVWKEVSLGEEGVGREAGWPGQVAEEGEGCREHAPCPSPGQAGGCCPSVGSGPPRTFSFSTSQWACGGGTPRSRPGCRSDRVRAARAHPLRRARGGAFLINPWFGRSSDHTLSSQVLETSFHSHRRPDLNHFAQFQSWSQGRHAGLVKCSLHLCSFSISLLKLTLGSGVTGLKGREKTEIFYPPGALRCCVWGGAGIFQAGAGRESASLPQRGPGL